MPWLSVVKAMLKTNGAQCWYSVRKPMITKNEKCASIDPPERITSPTQHDDRPAVTNSEPAMRPFENHPAAAVTSGTSAITVVSAGGLPTTRPKISRIGACAIRTDSRKW